MGCRSLGLVIALLFSSANLPATAEEAKPAAPAPRISAVGQVVDPDGKPAAGARVVLKEWASLRYSENVYEDVDDVLAETTTDADGRFQFADIHSRPFLRFRENAPWDVIASADGYGLAWAHLKKADDEKPVTLKLSKPKTIAGRLLDPDGKPIADCKVEAVQINAPGNRWHTGFTDPGRVELWRSKITPQAVTDRDGRFEIGGLPAGQRIAVATEHASFARGYFYVATTEEPQEAIEQPGMPRETKPVHMPGFTETLERGRQLRGQVVFSDTGEPAAKAKVNLTGQKGSFYRLADDTGRVEFTGLPDNQYFFSVMTEAPGYFSSSRSLVKFSNDAVQHAVTLRLPRGETVRGQVVDAESGIGVAGVGVLYLPPDAEADSVWSPSKPATSDMEGRFEISVPSGPGELLVYGDGNQRHPTHDVPDYARWRGRQGISAGHSAEIDVTAGEVPENVRLSVGRGLVIRGRVVDAEEQPVFGAVVRMRDRFSRADREKTTVTDDEGRFEFAAPPHEEQKIEIVDIDRKLRGVAKVPADPAADANRVADLGDIELHGTGTVVGTVLGDGKPIAGARVHLSAYVESDGRTEFESLGQPVETDEEGRFRFETVPADNRVSTWVDREGYTNQGTTSHRVVANEELEIPAIQLKSRGRFVAGVVVDPDGNPVAGATVSASERDGGSISFGRRGRPKPTDAEGRFRLEDLPNVPLRLMAYIRDPANTKGGVIHFPAHVNAEPGETDVRILLDPKLQRPLP